MDERRLYAILAIGAGLVVAVALLDVALGGDGDDREASPTTGPRTTSPSPDPAVTSTGLPSTTGPGAVLQDRVVQSDLRTVLAAMKIAHRETTRYPDDPSEVAAIEPAFRYAPGIATLSSVVGLVYVDASADGQVACASARSESGELFLIKEVSTGASPGTWFARGAVLPPACDDQALASTW